MSNNSYERLIKNNFTVAARPAAALVSVQAGKGNAEVLSVNETWFAVTFAWERRN